MPSTVEICAYFVFGYILRHWYLDLKFVFMLRENEKGPILNNVLMNREYAIKVYFILCS